MSILMEMTMLISRYLSLSACALLFGGCSVNGLLFKAENARPIVIIEHPPNRIGYVGDLDSADMANLQDVLRLMQTQKYRDHKFAFPLGAKIEFDSSTIENDTFTGASTTTIQRSNNEQDHSSDVSVDASTDGV